MRDEITHRQERKGKSFVARLLTPENLWAFLLFLIVAALIVFTTDDSPVWIYQGF
jgi:hypothetical protein